MDMKVTFVIVSLCTLALTSTEGIPKCCVKTRTKISARMLLKVERWNMQHNNGACDISALILHIKGLKKPICAPPKLKNLLESPRWVMKQNQLRPSL